MKCFFHEDREAVATCQRCGKSLCKECASKYSPVYCDECHSIMVADSRNRAEQRKQENIAESKTELKGILIKGLISGFIFAWIFLVAAKSDPNSTVLRTVFGLFAGFCFPFGWKVLRTVPFFYGRSEENMMIALMINLFKFLAALLIGIPAFLLTIIPVFMKYLKASKQ